MVQNKFTQGNKGRPPEYATPEDLAKVAAEYFDHCRRLKEKATITGAALYLGFCSRQSFYDYESKPDFSYTLKRIRLTVENAYETNGQTIDIFALKNMGWADRQAIDVTTDLSQLSEQQLIIIGNEIARQHTKND